MPTSKAYTGQRQDSGSGLDDYGARYYDALAGQFTSADTLPDVNPIVFGGEPAVAAQLLNGAGAQAANRYGYVTGNPETATDPTGRRSCDADGNCVIVKPVATGSGVVDNSSANAMPLSCDTGSTTLDCHYALLVQADAQEEAGVFGFPAVVGGGLASLQAIVVQYLERHGLQEAIDWLAHNFVGEFIKTGLAVTALWSAFAGTMFFIEGYFTPLDSLKDKGWVKQYFGWWKHAVNVIGTTLAGAGIGIGIGTDGGALLDPQYWAFFGGGTIGAVGIYAILQEQENRQLSEYNKVPEGLVSCQADPGATVCNMV